MQSKETNSRILSASVLLQLCHWSTVPTSTLIQNANDRSKKRNHPSPLTATIDEHLSSHVEISGKKKQKKTQLARKFKSMQVIQSAFSNPGQNDDDDPSECVGHEYCDENLDVETKDTTDANKKKLPSRSSTTTNAQRGSLDTTCRRVLRALDNKQQELQQSGPPMSFKFQAAQLSDDIDEVRRRVYDVLPVLEAVGVVSRFGRLYVHHGLNRMGITVQWIIQCVNLAKNMARGDHPDTADVPPGERKRHAGKLLKLVIENGPQFDEHTGELVGISMHTLEYAIEREKLRREQAEYKHGLTELKTLGIITLHMIVILMIEGPDTLLTMSELGDRINHDPEQIFLELYHDGDDRTTVGSSSLSQKARSATAPVILNAVDHEIMKRNPSGELKTEAKQDREAKSKSGAGRRLYDVVSVMSGVGLLNTQIPRPTILSPPLVVKKKKNRVKESKNTVYKAKCLRLHPVVFDDENILRLHEILAPNIQQQVPDMRMNREYVHLSGSLPSEPQSEPQHQLKQQ